MDTTSPDLYALWCDSLTSSNLPDWAKTAGIAMISLTLHREHPELSMEKAHDIPREQMQQAVQALCRSGFMSIDRQGLKDKSWEAFMFVIPAEYTSAPSEGDLCFCPREWFDRFDDYQEREQRATDKSRQETILYRYYDAEDVLLYIGITKSLMGRQASHEKASTWMEFATRSTMERFPTRMAAEAAEKSAIRRDRPLFNVEHNDHPNRAAMLVDYLIYRNRRDLLVPLISRG